MEDQNIDKESTEDSASEKDPTKSRAEKTATKISFEDLLLNRKAEQTFEIRDGLKVTMRTINAGLSEHIGVILSSEYGRDIALVFDEMTRNYQLACAVQDINGNKIGADLDDLYDKDDSDALTKALEARIKYLKKLPTQIIDVLYSHFIMFTERVEKAIKGGDKEVKNS